MYRSYESHVRLYLRPHLGKVRRDRVRVGHLDAMFEAIVDHNEVIAEYRASGDPREIAAVKRQRPVGPSSLHRIRESLRAILSPAVKEGLLSVNVAKLVELPPAVRPRPRLWTPERVALWRETGEVPYPVMVWTGEFLGSAVNHPLYPLFHLIAYAGLRRDEARGQRCSDTFLDAASLEAANPIGQYGQETGQSKPKTRRRRALSRWTRTRCWCRGRTWPVRTRRRRGSAAIGSRATCSSRALTAVRCIPRTSRTSSLASSGKPVFRRSRRAGCGTAPRRWRWERGWT